jgi:hypothetical protein
MIDELIAFFENRSEGWQGSISVGNHKRVDVLETKEAWTGGSYGLLPNHKLYEPKKQVWRSLYLNGELISHIRPTSEVQLTLFDRETG